MRPLLSSETVLAASIVVGIAVPPIAELLRPLLYVFVFFLMLFSLLAIRLRDAWPDSHLSGRVFRIMGWQMIALPVMLGLWHRFSPWSGQWSELVFVTACAGTIFGAPAFARVMKLDDTLTLRGVIAGTLLMPLVLPLTAPLVTERASDFDFAAYAGRLVVFILLPLAAAGWYQTRRRGQWVNDRLWFGRLTIVFLVLFGIAIMEGVGAHFVSQPRHMIGLLALALVTHVLFFASSALLFGRWGRHQALTAGLLAGYRNLAIVLAVGGSLLPPGFIIYAALWQIPMYLTPLAVRIWQQYSAGSKTTRP